MLIVEDKNDSAAGKAPQGVLAESLILTTQCPDTTGVVAAVSGFLAAHNALITQAQHFDDSFSNTSFMRVVFHDNGKGMPDPESMMLAFQTQVASRFNMKYQLHRAAQRCRVVLAVSKHGHCLNSILHRWSTGTLPVDVLAVVSNHEDMRRLAEWHGVPFYHFPVINNRKAEQEQRIIELFERVGADLLVLARYMQILSEHACKYFTGRAINIHHSFLPGFKGARAYYQAFDRGVKLIGATAHFVTADLDEGPIINQEVERVDHTFSPDDLTDLGRDLESLTLNRAIKWYAEHRVLQNGNKTVIMK